MAGHLTAARVQLRRDPAGRRWPLRVRRPRGEARGAQGRCAAGGTHVTDAPRVVLVVANETLAGDELVDAVRARAEAGPIRAVVIAPVSDPRSARVVYEDSRRAAAGRRLDRTVARLRQEGIPALGDVLEGGPLTAVEDALALERVDE